MGHKYITAIDDPILAILMLVFIIWLLWKLIAKSFKNKK